MRWGVDGERLESFVAFGKPLHEAVPRLSEPYLTAIGSPTCLSVGGMPTSGLDVGRRWPDVEEESPMAGTVSPALEARQRLLYNSGRDFPATFTERLHLRRFSRCRRTSEG